MHTETQMSTLKLSQLLLVRKRYREGLNDEQNTKESFYLKTCNTIKCVFRIK